MSKENSWLITIGVVAVIVGSYYAYTRLYLPWHYKPLVKTWVAEYGKSNLDNIQYDLSEFVTYTAQNNWSGISSSCNSLSNDAQTWMNDPSFPVPIIAVNLNLALQDFKNAADACTQAYNSSNPQWAEVELKLSNMDLSQADSQMQTVNRLDKQYGGYF